MIGFYAPTLDPLDDVVQQRVRECYTQTFLCGSPFTAQIFAEVFVG
jgi:hypothetical protein